MKERRKEKKKKGNEKIKGVRKGDRNPTKFYYARRSCGKYESL